MACSLPENFFLQASEYEKFLVAEVKSMFMPVLVSSGMMGCLLNMVSQSKVNYCHYDYDCGYHRYYTNSINVPF